MRSNVAKISVLYAAGTLTVFLSYQAYQVKADPPSVKKARLKIIQESMLTPVSYEGLPLAKKEAENLLQVTDNNLVVLYGPKSSGKTSLLEQLKSLANPRPVLYIKMHENFVDTLNQLKFTKDLSKI